MMDAARQYFLKQIWGSNSIEQRDLYAKTKLSTLKSESAIQEIYEIPADRLSEFK